MASLKVIGHFVAEGTAAESEVWMDRAIAQSVFRCTSMVGVARVKLAPDADVKALNQRLTTDRRLTSTLIPEQEFFAARSASRATLIDAFAYLIAGVMALGSVFGAPTTTFPSSAGARSRSAHRSAASGGWAGRPPRRACPGSGAPRPPG